MQVLFGLDESLLQWALQTWSLEPGFLFGPKHLDFVDDLPDVNRMQSRLQRMVRMPRVSGG